MNPIRIAGLAALAAGVLLLVLDVIENLLSTTWNGMAMGRMWALIWPGGMAAVQNFVEDSISVGLWQNLLLPLLALPAWVALLLAGLVLLVVAKRYQD